MQKLPSQEIQLWYVDQENFDSSLLAREYLPWLSESDKARYQRYYFDRHRDRFLLGRALLRSVLSQYHDVAPGQWQFIENEYGKPSIHPSQRSNEQPLFFNLSHSANRIVLAVCELEAIGVDIEASHKPRRVEKLCSRYFSETEGQALLALEPDSRLTRFYQLWTLKEAYIKATGKGLALPLQQFSYCLDDAARLGVSFDEVLQENPAHWLIWQLQAGRNFELALALDTGAPVVAEWSLSAFEMTAVAEFQVLETEVLRCSKPA